jgi:DNA-binding beta-propeller fold protein YncE
MAFSATPSKAQNSAGATDCNQAAAKPITLVDVPGRPFEPIPTTDGCWIFVSFERTPKMRAGIAVFRRSGGKANRARTVPVDGNPTGMVLTHDGRLLILADGEGEAFYDANALISGKGEPLRGRISDGAGSASIYANVTADDKFLFVSDERTASITVVNLEKAQATGFNQSAIIGKIPVATAPIAMEFSADGKYLFATSEVALRDYDWPLQCQPEGPNASSSGQDWPQGVIHVVDVATAETDPAHSVVGKAPAGCSTVRLVLSPKGDVAYVTARNSNAVMAFDVAKLLSDPAHALKGWVRVGSAPVGIAIIDGGAKVVATNSNRFAGRADDRQFLSVIDTAKLVSGAPSVLGTIPAGAFPRELRVTADGKTLLLTNFNSSTLEIIDLERLPMEPASK